MSDAMNAMSCGVVSEASNISDPRLNAPGRCGARRIQRQRSEPRQRSRATAKYTTSTRYHAIFQHSRYPLYRRAPLCISIYSLDHTTATQHNTTKETSAATILRRLGRGGTFAT